jgi:hypothetical protein
VSVPFKGKVNVDIRDSVEDWAPFAPPQAPDGAPNVVYIVLDDVGYSAMSCYGGPIKTPNIDKIAGDGLRYTQWHTTALCSPTRSCLLTSRNHTRNSMACITEASSGFANASGTIPPENGMLSEILAEQGWNTYMVGKWHLCPTVEMNLASTRRNWPSGRGFERWYGFLGAETSQWYPELTYDNHPVNQPELPEDGYHFSVDITDKAIEFMMDAKAVAPQKPFFLYYGAGRCSCAPPRPQGVDPEVQGPVRHGLRGDARGHWPARGRWASSRPTLSFRRSTPSVRPRRARVPRASRSRRWMSPGPGTPSPMMRSSFSPEWRRYMQASSVTPTIRSGACSTTRGRRCEVQLEPGMFGEPGHDVLVFVGCVVVQDHMNRKTFGYSLSMVRRNLRNSSWRCLSMQVPMTVPSTALRAANSVVVPCLL